ncbi:hypothetical protein ACIBF6_27645 [Streptosporangium amethystogenes]|uniref:hypothetical protein n=1 Tax=Streptosporangium amethystogenes TaxID=2002 RepID=UPI00379FA042
MSLRPKRGEHIFPPGVTFSPRPARPSPGGRRGERDGEPRTPGETIAIHGAGLMARLSATVKGADRPALVEQFGGLPVDDSKRSNVKGHNRRPLGLALGLV